MPILSHLHQLFDVHTCCAYIHRLRWKDRPLGSVLIVEMD